MRKTNVKIEYTKKAGIHIQPAAKKKKEKMLADLKPNCI